MTSFGKFLLITPPISWLITALAYVFFSSVPDLAVLPSAIVTGVSWGLLQVAVAYHDR